MGAFAALVPDDGGRLPLGEPGAGGERLIELARAQPLVFTMLVSIAIISWASATTARIPQRRGSPIAEGSTGPLVGTVGAVVAPGGRSRSDRMMWTH